MRKLLLAASFLAVMASCNKNKKDYAILSGTIKNPNGDKVTLYNSEGKELKVYTLSPEGTFKDTIRNAEGDYLLANANEYTPIYLADGYDVNVNVDAANFDETITYSGEGQEANEYIQKKSKKEREFRGKAREIFAKDEAEFLKDIDAYSESLNAELKKVQDKDFVEREKKNIHYTAVAQKKSYENLHGRVTGNADFKVSESYPNVMEGVALDNEEDFKQSQAYKQLVMMEFFGKAQKEAQEGGKTVEDVFLENVEGLKPGTIRDAMLVAGVDMLRGNYNEETKPKYEKILSLLSDKEAKAKLEEQINEYKKLESGNPSPKFVNLENYDGSTTSLDDFKGKYVYVDVWATWCGPCRGEIPHLKQIEEEYHKNKDLVFVSISIDEPAQKETWKKMIKDQEMGGVQLIESKEDNQFTKGYNVNSIPRFILIGKDGNIISSNAPRPSQVEELTALFEANGIKK